MGISSSLCTKSGFAGSGDDICCGRATSTDGMTADFYPFDMAFPGTRIINESGASTAWSMTSPRSRRGRSSRSERA
jgi:hypothetical protein